MWDSRLSGLTEDNLRKKLDYSLRVRHYFAGTHREGVWQAEIAQLQAAIGFLMKEIKEKPKYGYRFRRDL